MQGKKLIYFILAAILAINLILAGMIFHSRKSELSIYFFDVSQGDAILISQGKNQIIIDGGASSQKELEKLGKYLPFWDRKIEIIIATHPDQDHIGGLQGVLESYSVGKIIESDAQSDSGIFKEFIKTAESKKVERLRGEAGMKIKLDGAELEILHPFSGESGDPKDTNSRSIVTKLTFKNNSFLFTGDLPSEKEAELMDREIDLKSGVLKVSHHGSKYSTSPEFLEKVAPEEAVISVGKNNRYGHPAPEVLDRLKEKNIKILRTDEAGDVVYKLNQN